MDNRFVFNGPFTHLMGATRGSTGHGAAVLVFAAIVLAVIALAPMFTHAYLSEPAYHSATEPEHLLLDSRERWDSEAASDFLTFQRPLEWENRWLRGAKAFDLSVGSISSKQFLTYQRLKVHAPLTDRLEVRLKWLEERVFEQDRRALPLELRYRFTETLALSAFGQPSLYKSEDDVGLAVSVAPRPELEITAAALFADFQRNQRNLGTDRWQRAPRAYTLSMRHLPSNAAEFTSADLHFEPNSVREDNAAVTTTLGYRSAAAAGIKQISQTSSAGFRLYGDEAFHAAHATDTVRLRRRFLAGVEYGWLHGFHVLKPGLNFQYREHHQNAGREITRDVVPTFWWELPDERREWGSNSWAIGYDATVFNRDSTLRADSQAIEHRANVRSSLRFKQAGELALLFTFDLDRFGSGETWEGGAGQFRLDF